MALSGRELASSTSGREDEIEFFDTGRFGLLAGVDVADWDFEQPVPAFALSKRVERGPGDARDEAPFIQSSADRTTLATAHSSPSSVRQLVRW